MENLRIVLFALSLVMAILAIREYRAIKIAARAPRHRRPIRHGRVDGRFMMPTALPRPRFNGGWPRRWKLERLGPFFGGLGENGRVRAHKHGYRPRTKIFSFEKVLNLRNPIPS